MQPEQLNFIIDRLEAIDQKYDSKLDRILEQTTKTNGRVTNLEADRAKLETLYNAHNSNKAVGKVLWAAACVIGTVIGFLAERFINTFLNH